MQINITAMRLEGGELIITSPVLRQLYELASKFKPGEWELKRRKGKRSLDANGYAWKLIDMIAAALSIPKVEIYRNAIREIGGVSDGVSVREEAVDKLRENWESKGLGWQTDILPSQLKGCVTVVLYYGSSTYDTKQMSTLIDHLVQDAKALGLETMPPDKLAALTGEWGDS